MFEKKNGKRFLASVMALVMLLSLAPVGALAADEAPTTEECSAMPLPAAEGENQQDVADEDNPPPQPAVNPNSAEATNEATKLEEDLDEGFSVGADDADTSNDIAEQNLSLNKAPKKQSITAEFWLTNRHAKVGDVWKMTITKDRVGNDGTAVTDLAPPERRATADETYDTVFWQARVLSNWQRQTTENDDDKTASGTEIDSIRFQNNKFQYHDKNENRWKSFNSSNDQLVFYYLIRTDYSQMVQIDVSDWTVKDEPSNSQYPSHRGVTYQVIVDGGNDNGKVLDSKTFWYNRDLTVSAIRVRQTQSENYTISKVELTPNNLGTVAEKNGEYQFSLNLKNASTAEATVKIYVKPNVQPKHLSYQLNGGTIDTSKNYTAEGEVYPDAPVVTPSVSKEGCTFDGWYTDADFQNQWTGTTMPSENLTLHAKWTDPNPTHGPSTLVPAMFFINLGGKDDSNPNGIGTFTDKIEIPNALNKTTFEDHLDNSMGSNRGFIFNIEGVKKVQGCEDNKLLITEPDIDTINQRIIAKDKNDMTVGGNTGREVVWYHVSHCGDGYHVDGYVKGVPITLTYHENFGTSNAQTVIDKNSSGATLNSGDKVTIQSYEQVFTGEATKHEGWTFVGWFTANGQEYTLGETTLIDSVDLYAKWKKTYTVNFIGNGGVWDSSVSDYTMTPDENSKNIKATKTITVTPTTESTATVSKIATNPTKDKYDFLGWSKTIGGPIITENEWATMKPGETTTIDFYANWKAKQDPIPDTVNYTINQYFMNGKGEKDSALDKLGTAQSGEKGTALSKLIENLAKDQPKDGSKYVYVPGKTTYTVGTGENKRTENLVAAATLTEDTTIDLYYYLDNWKDGDSKTPTKDDSATGGDGIPDCDQVLIKYVSSNSDRGTVSPDMEVLTIRKDNKNVVPTANGSTATRIGSSRNYFSNWTDEVNNKTINDATLTADTIKKAIENAKGGDVYTFTANFDRSSGGGSGGSNRPKPPVVEIPDDVPTGLNGKDHYAYIIGYGNNDVRPQNNITRAEVATIFFRLLTDETREANMTKSNGYNDVKDGDWFCCAVSTLSKMGIIKGYEDGSFKPNDPISRAEFAAIAARFDPDGDKTPATFADVTSHWAKDEISIAANHGWIKGYEDGSFKPDQKITRAETMTLVNRVLNRLPETKDDLHKDMKTWVDNMDETAWYYLAVQEATNSHYFKNKTSTKFEQWTDLRDTRDWSELEK